MSNQNPNAPAAPVTEPMLTLNGFAPLTEDLPASMAEAPGYARATMALAAIPGPMRVVVPQTAHLRSANAKILTGAFPAPVVNPKPKE